MTGGSGRVGWIARTSRSARVGLLVGGKTPASIFTVHASLLLFPCHGRRALHAEHLVHWFTSRGIVAGKPALPVEWAGVFMLAPI
jgi:hypothetical protein